MVAAAAPRAGVTTPRIFFGWWIVAAGTVATALFSASRSYGAGLFLVPLINEFGWSRAELSLAFSLARLEGGILIPLGGLLIDRFGPRIIMLVGVPITALGFVLLAQLSSIAQRTDLSPLIVFYLIWVLAIALGDSIGTSDGVSAAVANWFRRRRSLALGVLSSGIPIGGALWIPALGQVMEHSGWRTAALAMGVSILLVGIPAALVMRHRPEPYGYGPDGDPLLHDPTGRVHTQPGRTVSHAAVGIGVERPAESTRPHVERPGYTVRQAMATSAFWVLNFSVALRIFVTSAVIVHIAALMQDLGMSMAEAAGMLSMLAIVSIIGRLAMGWLADRHDIRFVYMGALACLIAGLLIVASATQYWHLWVFMVLFSPAYGGLASMTPALRADLFGVRAFASIGGAMEPVLTLGTIIGPLFAGYVFDVTGSYRIAMLVFAAASVVNLGLISALRRPQLSHTTA